MLNTAPLPADYRDLGHMLKDTREGMGLTLEQATKTLRIRLSYLQALERGDLSAIPGDVYARGYLKSYADYLGYDGAGLIGRIKAGEAKPQTTKYLPPDRSSSKGASAAVIVVSALLLIAAGWWQMNREHATSPRLVEPLPAQLDHLLDRGTPRIREEALSPLCVEVTEAPAKALCTEDEPFWARLYDQKPPLATIMALSEPLAVWYKPGHGKP